VTAPGLVSFFSGRALLVGAGDQKLDSSLAKKTQRG
jgi:hypothetical protein